MRIDNTDAKLRAERYFKAPSPDERSSAWTEYRAAQDAVRERMQRQRKARLAKKTKVRT